MRGDDIKGRGLITRRLRRPVIELFLPLIFLRADVTQIRMPSLANVEHFDIFNQDLPSLLSRMIVFVLDQWVCRIAIPFVSAESQSREWRFYVRDMNKFA